MTTAEPRDQVEAEIHERGRVVAALLLGSGTATHEPAPSPVRHLLLGVLLAALLMLGAVALEVLS